MENQKTEAVTQQKQETVTKQKNALRIEQRKRLVEYNLCKKEELNPIHPGGGVFSTSKPVNSSELQNETSYNLETW